MAETLNMIEISVDKFISEIRIELEDENYNPIIGIGKSGVGKTMSISELTEELGIGFCELRLVTLTEIDLLGIPTIENGRTTYASNELLPDIKRDGEAGILVLDEITSATSTIRAAAYQLLDSKRRLGNYKLPPKWKVIALGNGPDDGGVFQGMESAFLSRATCYRIEPNLQAWKKWAVKNHVNSSILAFLSYDTTKLHEFNPDEIASVFPCPRSWTALSTKLNSREERNGGTLNIEDITLWAAGCIGNAVADSFAAFYDYNKSSSMISAEDILNGKALSAASINKVIKAEPQVMYLVIQNVIKQLGIELEKGHKDYGEFTLECVNRTANVCKWLMAVSDKRLDYAVTGIKDISGGSKYFSEMALVCEEFDDNCPEFIEFTNKRGLIFKSR